MIPVLLVGLSAVWDASVREQDPELKGKKPWEACGKQSSEIQRW